MQQKDIGDREEAIGSETQSQLEMKLSLETLQQLIQEQRSTLYREVLDARAAWEQDFKARETEFVGKSAELNLHLAVADKQKAVDDREVQLEVQETKLKEAVSALDLRESKLRQQEVEMRELGERCAPRFCRARPTL